MILTEIGEVGVQCNDSTFVLRPSFYAMTQLGNPVEIVRVYASVMSEVEHRDQFIDALGVLYACAVSDMPPIFGYYTSTKDGLRYVRNEAEEYHVVPLARCLMKHGVTGALPKLPEKGGDEPEYIAEFDARSYVSLAIAHLGMSSVDAWNMTMTELIGALRAKFPLSESNSSGSRAPTLDEHDETMAWFDRVEKARAKALGAH